MLFIESIETVKCLDEGVIETVADANIGSIFGIGFPGWTGGVLQYINGYDGGVAGFVARARELADKYGERFEPPESLLREGRARRELQRPGVGGEHRLSGARRASRRLRWRAVKRFRRTAWVGSLCACTAALWAAAAAAAAQPGTGFVDGISDQSLPAWDGSFLASPFAGLLEQEVLSGQSRQITMARYVVQWNAASQPSEGPNAAGDYRERLEAWLADISAAGLTPVLALTSYDGHRPADAGEYAAATASPARPRRGAGNADPLA